MDNGTVNKPVASSRLRVDANSEGKGAWRKTDK